MNQEQLQELMNQTKDLSNEARLRLISYLAGRSEWEQMSQQEKQRSLESVNVGKYCRWN